ncbi:uncharacterized protein EKO05_0004250 [Ascochyta rabiei]|uniref:Uncharacterized protein n=1 Tax=Didymella rabiei TaxID=5454 RepID=A0A162XH76_DIDRA|nr:uncharacterized protein EKO05_0004250 [Ascochyta rabiei]KZM19546.1 hypothetical protein ST47_g9074 [Ascochyta rabiei]UPX13751.1 hypothetical protein EKO05_0004250 [Ascochyta rabiei]
MSWSFQLQKINQAFEKIAGWYYEFLQRTEDGFRALHDRVLYLEERQTWQGPSDEQLERVLRKILAERFADDESRHTDSTSVAKGTNFIVEDARSRSTIRPITIDAASLFVEPESVPSRVYAETFEMLEGRLTDYPRVLQAEPADEGVSDGRIKIEYERSIL